MIICKQLSIIVMGATSVIGWFTLSACVIIYLQIRVSDAATVEQISSGQVNENSIYRIGP